MIESPAAPTVTVFTGLSTRSANAPVCDPLVAEMVALPALTPVTVMATVPAALVVPLVGETLATAVLVVVMVTAREGRGFEFASRTVTLPASVPAAITQAYASVT